MGISIETATAILNLLVEGVGINAASRIAGVNKRTALSVLALAGERCEKLMDEKLRNLPLVDIQCDEIWTFVGKKEARVTASDNAVLVGDQYTFVSIDRDSKLVINYAVGKRTAPMTQHFTADLADPSHGSTPDQYGLIRSLQAGNPESIRRPCGSRANREDLRKGCSWCASGGSPKGRKDNPYDHDRRTEEG
jgi:hypothetical protein